MNAIVSVTTSLGLIENTTRATAGWSTWLGRESRGSGPTSATAESSSSTVAQPNSLTTTSSPIEYRPTAGWSTCFRSRRLWVRVPPAPLTDCCAVAQRQSTVKSLANNFVGPFEQQDTHSTAVVEYMAKQVRLLPGPLMKRMGPDPVGDDKSLAGKALPNTSSSALRTRSDCPSGVHPPPMPGKRELPSAATARRLCSPLVGSLFVKEVTMANKSSVCKPEEPLRPRRRPQRGGRPGLRAGAEARPGAAGGHRLLQRHVLRRRPTSSSTRCRR